LSAALRQKSVVRKELQAQLKMIEEIDRLTSFDAENIKALRARIDALKLKTPRRAKPKAPAAAHQSDLDGWKYVRSWASHRPSAWE
jgi:hypothetical protein